ncbi:MAG: hypothetical protein LBU16_04210 [Treponema sp.]|jgi:hypothetical protein|nr:hypothetical protein [Treponema sp.]
MSGSEKGGNNRRGFQRRERDKNRDRWGKDAKKKGNGGSRFDKAKGTMVDRPKWVPPVMSCEPIPVPNCPYCGKPIRDLSAALTDRHSGEAIHFDCVLRRLRENEILERGDAVTYIGAGRFGVVHFANPNDRRGFTIKKVFEWETRENRAEWRKSLADHYSIT